MGRHLTSHQDFTRVEILRQPPDEPPLDHPDRKPLRSGDPIAPGMSNQFAPESVIRLVRNTQLVHEGPPRTRDRTSAVSPSSPDARACAASPTMRRPGSPCGRGRPCGARSPSVSGAIFQFSRHRALCAGEIVASRRPPFSAADLGRQRRMRCSTARLCPRLSSPSGSHSGP